ncbi:MAG: hypothetical protein ABI140_13735 [Jatrophihabitantaceae bacterium]
MPQDDPPVFRLLPDSDDEFEPVPGELPVAPAGRLGRAPKLIAGATVLALLVSGAVVQLHRSRTAARQAELAQSARGQVPAAPAAGAPTRQPWPSAPTGVCGGPGQLLPVLSSKPLTEPTHVRLVVGSNGIRTVDLDDGSVSAKPQVVLREGNLVMDDRQLGGVNYLIVNSCGGALRLLRQRAGEELATSGIGNLASSSLFGNAADGIWAATFTAGTTLAEARLQVTMTRLDRPGTILLPANSFPISLDGDLVVCETLSANGTGPQKLVVYDRSRHRIVHELGAMTTVTSSQGRVLWTSVACSAASTCPLHSYDLRSQRTSVRNYALPVESGITGAVLSPDLGRLAFQLPRMTSDERYQTRLSGVPSDLVVLNLASGILEPIPNLELPPGTNVGMTFSRDSRWLVVGVTDAHGPKLLAWRSGLDAPLASSARLPGPVPDPVPLRLLTD